MSQPLTKLTPGVYGGVASAGEAENVTSLHLSVRSLIKNVFQWNKLFHIYFSGYLKFEISE